MKNHAFIIPCHTQPKLLARIISVLQARNHYFFVHVSGQVENYAEFVAACNGLKNVKFVQRIPVYWAGISQVYATIVLLKAVSEHPVHFSYVHQISGQDYPLRSNEQFDAFFETTQESFMCYNYEKDMDYWNKIYADHTNGWFSNGKDCFYDRIFLKVANSRLRYFFTRSPIEGVAGAWDWWSWSDRVVNYILQELKRPSGKSLLKRFNHTHAPGEHFFATLLYSHIEKLKIRKHFPLRYISWAPHRPIETKKRPYNLNELDFDYVINSAAFFCRKVDEIESAKFLDMVDAQRDNSYDITEHDYFL